MTETGAICAAAGVPVFNGEPLDLSRLLSTGFDPRAKLPRFSWDSQCGDFIDATIVGPNSPFPDPTFAGLLPGMTQQGLLDKLGLRRDVVVHKFFGTLLSYHGGTVMIQHGGGKGASPLNIRNITLAVGDAFQIYVPPTPFTLCGGANGYSWVDFTLWFRRRLQRHAADRQRRSRRTADRDPAARLHRFVRRLRRGRHPGRYRQLPLGPEWTLNGHRRRWLGECV